MDSKKLIELLDKENIEVRIGSKMHPETFEIIQVENRQGVLLICSAKRSASVACWNNGHNVGRSSGFVAGKWAGYTQALSHVLKLIPGGTLKESIRLILDKAITTGVLE